MKKIYFAKKVSSPMTIVDERWEKAPFTVLDQVWEDFYPSPYHTDLRVVYSEDGITIKMTSTEWPLHTACQYRNQEVCEDSCMEFFLSPCSADKRYFNIEINAVGASLVGIGENRYDRKKLNILGQGFIIQTLIHPEEGWDMMCFIPKSFILKYFPSWDKEMRSNSYKIGNSSARKHYSTWNKLDLEMPDFHRSEFFGDIILTDEEI